jgi:uncharacterized protein YjiS (DUF1127 family)
MTTTLITINSPKCRPHFDHQPTVSASLSALWTNYKRRRARRRTERILAGLSERTLKDIGFTAHEIGSVVHGEPGHRLHRHDDCWDERVER